MTRTASFGAALLAIAGLGSIAIALRPAFVTSDGVAATPATLVAGPTTLASPPSTRVLPTPSVIEPATAPPTDPLSPLAAQLGPRGSALVPEIEPRARPMAIAIGDLKLLAPIRPVGLEPDGQLEVPDETEVGWYQYGASPQRPGATVLAAHVSWNGSTGPFHQLRRLQPGATVEVGLDDGTTITYQVIERAVYDKDELPHDRIWTVQGPETLVLITCGGSFNPAIRRYRDNVVIYAVPLTATPSPAPPS